MTENINDRIAVSKLLRRVRIGELCVRDALLLYPKDTDDESLIAAYHALIHYEADEDIRRQDIMYKEEQDEYLAFLSDTLSKNRTLPQNIIKSYKGYAGEEVALPKDKNINKLLLKLCKFLNIK